MHPVRQLFDGVPQLLVEFRQVSRPRRAVAVLSLDRRQPRRSHRRAPGPAGGFVPVVPLPYEHELHEYLPEGIGSRAGDRRDQAVDGRAPRRLMTPTTPVDASDPVGTVMSQMVRGAAAFLLAAGLAALIVAGRMLYLAAGVVAVLGGVALAINGVALSFLGYSPALFGRAPRHWPTIILVFAVSVALEIVKRVL